MPESLQPRSVSVVSRGRVLDKKAIAPVTEKLSVTVNGIPVSSAPSAPADLPASLGTARDRFMADTKRAETSNDSVRKHTVDTYLKWLSGIQDQYAKVKDTATIAVIEGEKKRVLAIAESKAKP